MLPGELLWVKTSMSTISRPAPSPVPPGEGTPSPASAPSPPGGRKFLLLVVFGVTVAAAAWFYWPKSEAAEQAAAAAVVRTAAVTRGPLEVTLRVAGVTSSVQFANVRAPTQQGPERMSLILLDLLPSGAQVKKGDRVGTIDGQGLKDHIDDVHATVVASEADIKKRRAEQSVDYNNLVQQVTTSRATRDKWKLEARAAEVRTVIDREILRIGHEESDAALAEKQKELALKQAEQKAEVRILELTTERHRRHRDRHAYDLERYTIEAPMDGMVVRQQIFRSGEFAMVEVGDRLYPGVLFVKIMDTENMQVEGVVNQTDGHAVKIGMEARVGLDAFPELQFEGTVHSIGALAKSGSQNQFIREIPIRIRIKGSHPKLIPDLSAYADVVLEQEDNVTLVPRAAVFEEAGQPYVFVRRGERFEKRPVELGRKNPVSAAVVSGLEPGEEVALEKPAS